MHRVGALFALLSVCFAQLHSTGSMQLYGCNASSPNQVYDYTAQQTFQGRFSGLCITASGSSGAQTLWPVTCEVGEPLQKFVVEVGGRIRLATTNLVLNVPGSRVYDFAEVALSPNSTVAPEANERFSYNTSTGLILGDESGLCVDAGTTAPLTFLATVFGEHMVLQVCCALRALCRVMAQIGPYLFTEGAPGCRNLGLHYSQCNCSDHI